MSRFIAIPVTQGDSFYLERGGFSVLIDGGRNHAKFPSMFQRITKRDGVNVIVCTHNDADHANGILGYLEAGLGCEEVWLPGRWLSVLPDVLRPFDEVVKQLADDVAETDTSTHVEEPQSSLSPLEAYAERMHRGRIEDSTAEEMLSAERDGWPEQCAQMLEQAEPWEALSCCLGSWHPDDRPIWLCHHYRMLGPAGDQLLWSAIDAADRIRAIATAAFHRGIPVRWFEFGTGAPSGGTRMLQPINGRAVAKVYPRVAPLLEYLALTVSNKESLVFWSPAAEGYPGVLFTADSDLTSVSLPSSLDNAIVTAPHHGSEKNANAYSAVASTAQNNAQSITWVRSDGRYRSRPGSTYLRLSSRRLCTLCRHAQASVTAKQAVHLYSRGGTWVRHRASQGCSCQ